MWGIRSFFPKEIVMLWDYLTLFIEYACVYFSLRSRERTMDTCMLLEDNILWNLDDRLSCPLYYGSLSALGPSLLMALVG